MESSTGSDNKPQQKKKPQRKEGNERRDRSKSHRPKGKQSAKTNKDKEKEAAAPVPEPAPAEPDASQKEDDDDASSVDSGELCFICTEPIVTYAVGACDHRFCHLCALRLRALYKTRNCAYCKTEQPIVIFTKDAEKPFESYTPNDSPYSDKKLGLRFEDKQSYQDTMLLLQFNCPDPSCDVACDGWSELKRHVKKAHDRYLCDLCTKHKKIFAHEHTLYTWHQLHKHYKSGDKALSDETGFKGHPECHFCHISFYGTDELYEHCRDKHEQCHICVRNGIRHEYYANYDSLEQHFKNDHYLCIYRECLDRKFVVFESDIDLKAHEVEEHGAPISRLQRSKQTEARRVDVQFDYGRGERNTRRNKPRAEEMESNGREAASTSTTANRRPSPSSSRAQSILSEENFPAVGAAAPAQSSSSASTRKSQQKQPQKGICKPPGFGALSADNWPTLGASSSASGSSSGASASALSSAAASVDPQTVSKHAAFLERVFDMLKSHEKVSQYRSLTKAYRENSIDVDTYVNEVADLCNSNIEHLRKIFKGTEELMDIPEKKTEIVRTWRNKEIAIQNFPALDAQPAGHGTSSRVLVIKSKNTRAGGTRTTGKSKAGVWDRVASAASGASGGSPTRSSPQSSRPSSPALFPPPVLMNGQRTAWSGAAARSQTAEENFPALKPADHFPSLPSAPKPASRIHFRRNNKAETANAWGGGSAAAVTADTEPPADEGIADQGKKKKGKKNKQVLMRVGL